MKLRTKLILLTTLLASTASQVRADDAPLPDECETAYRRAASSEEVQSGSLDRMWENKSELALLMGTATATALVLGPTVMTKVTRSRDKRYGFAAAAGIAVPLAFQASRAQVELKKAQSNYSMANLISEAKSGSGVHIGYLYMDLNHKIPVHDLIELLLRGNQQENRETGEMQRGFLCLFTLASYDDLKAILPVQYAKLQDERSKQ